MPKSRIKLFTLSTTLFFFLSSGFSVQAQENALDFDGSGDYVTTANISLFSQLTYEAWINTTGTNLSYQWLVQRRHGVIRSYGRQPEHTRRSV